MPREEPFFKKCCFCIPLKSCLFTWACIKLITDIALAIFLILAILLLSLLQGSSFEEFSTVYIFFSVVIVLLVVDSSFIIILIVGLSKKNLRTLRVFYYYSIYMVLAGAAFLLGAIIYGSLSLYFYGDHLVLCLFIGLIVCGLVNSTLDMFIIFTLKSEMIKLRNKQQYEFVKIPSLKDKDGAESGVEEVNLSYNDI